MSNPLSDATKALKAQLLKEKAEQEAAAQARAKAARDKAEAFEEATKLFQRMGKHVQDCVREINKELDGTGVELTIQTNPIKKENAGSHEVAAPGMGGPHDTLSFVGNVNFGLYVRGYEVSAQGQIEAKAPNLVHGLDLYAVDKIPYKEIFAAFLQKVKEIRAKIAAKE